jgi:hypothetical protein
MEEGLSMREEGRGIRDKGDRGKREKGREREEED